MTMFEQDSGELSDQARSVLRGIQIIVLALLLGVLATGGVLWVLAEEKLDGELSFLSGLALVISIGNLVFSLVAPELISGRSGVTDPMQIWTQQVLVGAAILEGAVFLNLLAMFIDHCWYSAAAAGVLFVVMLLRFPTASRLMGWLKLRSQEGRSGE